MTLIQKINYKQAKECFLLDSKSIGFWNINQWENELKRNTVNAFAIYKKKKIVGIYVFETIFEVAELNFIAIHPDLKRKGLGKKLLNHFLDYCENKKIIRVLLEVSIKNTSAIKFYKYFGFRTINIREKYYKDGSDALFKEKKLLKK